MDDYEGQGLGKRSRRKSAQSRQDERRRRSDDRIGNAGGRRDEVALVWALLHGALHDDDDPSVERALDMLETHDAAVVGAVVRDDIGGYVTRLWLNGWQPSDLARVVRKRGKSWHESIVAAAVLADARGYRDRFRDPSWLAQLDEVAETWNWGSDAPEWGANWLGRWSSWTGTGWRGTLNACAETVHQLCSLPCLEVIGPYPGGSEEAFDLPPGLPPKLLERVAALLRKAESTDFPEEADALSAKAQELMSRHAIDAAVLARTGGRAERPRATRVGVDDPHASARALLLQEIADANRCRAAWSKDLGYSTLCGFDCDVAIVEMLFASLLVQATRAMVAYGSVVDVDGARRTGSFRKSFLTSYAVRIGERLCATVDSAVGELASAQSDLLPVLASRRDEVDRHFETLVTVGRKGGSSRSMHGGGWYAGRAAADAADLAAFDAVEGGVSLS